MNGLNGKEYWEAATVHQENTTEFIFRWKPFFNALNLSLIHIFPVEEDWDKRLDNNNLLTICEKHHIMAEQGDIPREVIKKIICEQEGEV